MGSRWMPALEGAALAARRPGALGRQSRLAEHVSRPGHGRRTTGRSPDPLLGRQGASLRRRRKRGARNQAIPPKATGLEEMLPAMPPSEPERDRSATGYEPQP